MSEIYAEVKTNAARLVTITSHEEVYYRNMTVVVNRIMHLVPARLFRVLVKNVS